MPRVNPAPAIQPDPASIPVISAWAPLRRRVFAALWIGGLSVNIGIWIRETGAGWLMTDLRPTPIMVSLVSVSTTLPMFLLSIPAGALADVLDRRRLMLVVQIFGMLIAALLAATVLAGRITAELLLLCMLALGAAQALVNPAWQAAMADLVPREELPAASTLNSVSLNLSRAIGPGLGGVAMAYLAGPIAAFVISALSFIAIIAALAFWTPAQPARSQSSLSGERFFGAMRAGLRYVRHSPPLHSVLVRTLSFVLAASSLWALMPLIARDHLGTDAGGFGTLMGCMGLGAVLATLVLPRVRTRLNSNQQVVFATILYAVALTLIALVPDKRAALPAMALAGAAWVTMVVNLNVAAQTGVPPWVRGRALATYFTVFFGSMAVSSPIWGAIATVTSLPTAMLISAAVALAGLVTMLRFPLTLPSAADLERSGHWESPQVSRAINPDDGPVVITIEYFIPEARSAEFAAAMQPVAQTRWRDGAISWTLARCTENPRRWLEVFVVESWAEHLRQHDRVTHGDRKVQDHARSFHEPTSGEPERPRVSHFIAAR